MFGSIVIPIRSKLEHGAGKSSGDPATRNSWNLWTRWGRSPGGSKRSADAVRLVRANRSSPNTRTRRPRSFMNWPCGPLGSNDRAQARRGNGLRFTTEARTRRCLEPARWAASFQTLSTQDTGHLLRLVLTLALQRQSNFVIGSKRKPSFE